MERLSVMGLVEVLGRLRELLKRRKLLIADADRRKAGRVHRHRCPGFHPQYRTQAASGRDQDRALRQPVGLGWRQKRVLKIREGCDLMLTLLPFEARFYEEQGVPVRFRRPSAGRYHSAGGRSRRSACRTGLADGPLVALMPGSRGGEVGRLGALFLDAAERLRAVPGVRFVCPAPMPRVAPRSKQMLEGRDCR
jgi:lipid-A-disaccharide synthase